MKTTIKKWGLLFLVLGLVSACGGDNDSSGVGGNNVTNNESLNNGVNKAQGTATFKGFIAEVERGHFEGQSRDRDFYYIESSGSSSNCDTLWGFIEYCSYDYGNGSGTTSRVRGFDENGDLLYRENLEDIDTFGDSLTEIRDRLVSRMKSASPSEVYKCLSNVSYYMMGEVCLTEIKWRQRYNANKRNFSKDPENAKSSRYIFKHDDGFTYLVDLESPLGAQPVGIMKGSRIFNSTY